MKKIRLFLCMVCFSLCALVCLGNSPSNLVATSANALKADSKASFVVETDENVAVVPILMYHAVLPNCYRPDKYSIRIDDLVKDLDYIQDAGYTTIVVSDLIAFKENAVALPKKPIMITFDDGFYSIKKLVLPKLKERNQKIVCSVVGKYLEDDAAKSVIYSYLDYKDLIELEESGLVEVQNHTNNLHILGKRLGAKKIRYEDEEHYKSVFKSDITLLQDKLAKFNVYPSALAYPFGYYEKHSDDYLREMGFKASFSCSEKINYLTRESSLFALKRFNRSGVGSTAQNILTQNIKK